MSTVVFDCGDTLLTLAPPREELCQQALQRLEIYVPYDTIALAYRMVDFRLTQKSSRLKSVEEKRAFHLAYNSMVAEALGLESRTEEVDRTLFEVFSERRHWQPFPGTFEALEDLRLRHELFVLANWDTNLVSLLEKTKLAPFFSGIFSSAELGAEKPDPAAFAEFAKRSGVVPQEATYIGNEYRADIAGSRAAGFRPILFDRANHYGSHVDCEIVTDWKELIETIETKP